MSKNIAKDQNADKLFEAILALRNVDECYNFFDDLCTVVEVESMVQRFLVARMLAGGLTYAEIEEHTNTSTATISRINKCLLRGEGGYRTIIDRVAE